MHAHMQFIFATFPIFTQLSGTRDISTNYEKCKMYSGTFEIGLIEAIGIGVIKYDSSLQTAIVTLPYPIQDTLTTVVRNCDAEW